jgi:hypothetical protein
LARRRAVPLCREAWGHRCIAVPLSAEGGDEWHHRCRLGQSREAFDCDWDPSGSRLAAAPHDADLDLRPCDTRPSDVVAQAAQQRFPLRLRQHVRAPELWEPWAELGKRRVQCRRQDERDHGLGLFWCCGVFGVFQRA